jgi:uncharacterized membrane protein
VKTLFSRSLCFFAPAFFCAAVFFSFTPDAHAGQAPVVVDSDLVIPLKDMSSTAIFYPVEVGGVIAEFIAVKAPDGSIRVVVNACQSCGPAGFKQNRDNFTCSACGQSFHVTVLEKQRGGCNPIPVGAGNKRIDADNITLPLDFLKQVASSRYAKGRRG